MSMVSSDTDAAQTLQLEAKIALHRSISQLHTMQLTAQKTSLSRVI
ncbi:hypothetical protein [Novosphingobium jiangmenense]|uniref:Uncharacterized protein n=1 Tax=Novosphingobium jiangmenense TaxID=2791981 RepID=A0ABS0HFN6_9SPHN|nr:hypothetical protein [Novosphingobium jiangmenense]MBF9151087.1 hypothetical protein [Novosphingobium jiangmenense]